MAEKTGIEWCDATFNPWMGCTRVSPACDDCYAARSTPARTLGVEWGAGQPRRRTADANWATSKRWNGKPFAECTACRWRGEQRDAESYESQHPGPLRGLLCPLICPSCGGRESLRGSRRRVFCASLADWLDNEVPIKWLVDLLDLVQQTPNLDWLLLSKRIGNWRKRLEEAFNVVEFPSELSAWLAAWLRGTPPANVWVMATICNQPEADRDVAKLLAVPARARGLSIEPMLGPVDIRFAWADARVIRCPRCMFGTNDLAHGPCPNDGETLRNDPGIDWVICGGESGPHARPMRIEWAHHLRQQCEAAGVAFHMKQLGAVVLTDGITRPGEHWPPGAERIERPRHADRDPAFEIHLKHRKGADMAEWPEALRVREFPA